MSTCYVASDIGGTFTDTVVIDDSGPTGRRRSSTVPEDPAQVTGVPGTHRLAVPGRTGIIGRLPGPGARSHRSSSEGTTHA
ncbi:MULTISPECIES: hypothetical protein [Pseudonocardia]|uniref:Hydantoinase/oxoprolinase N-terminal domain-containing protein n=2 Tax=Pseudonocardia TaxID=1847 RepID=A0A1Y2MRA8_PSEAH|nr:MULTISPECIES: hypothetical protein [Pseudonocardia]OSY37750.1 hypothetical protein BG845_04571 [Pseudonocardia autotrophica]TDN75760.1 hypothetical protein C8E95_4943 [Pseudonocardia autotrophica]BBF99730.1 hypothetical protein Pdca_09400 [Pseudonocardia autotrophica]GEC27179.1 hypothetical protein PSA01_42080 [Pseudonocardia saturnea]